MINLNWVKDYIDIDGIDLKELALTITKAGINIEKVITNHIDNLVIGKIVSVEKHPDSDHLHVCMVDVGSSTIQIVCGAPNVKENTKVVVALPGAELPQGITIKEGSIRGVKSNGMMCALFELGLEEKNEENYSKGIYILNDDAVVGTDPLKYLNLDDTLYELDVHKHRNNDCYYHIGFAYEIASILNKKVNLPNFESYPIKDNISSYFNLKVETNKCPYYLAKMVTNVKVKESPEFIKKRLQSVGIRSINNVVDISNYVMLEYGQPLHFFDKDSLGNNILVRNALDNEEIITLDNQKRILNHNDIVITNDNSPVAIAGIMGGLNTEIESTTKNILIESAIFDSISIRNTASKLNLKSEASIRYGKGLNYEYTSLAIERACYLLEKYADATVLEGTVIHDNIDKTPKKVEFSGEEINSLLGITISEESMKTELDRLDFPYQLINNKFIVTIPSRRLDIDPNVNDIAEEIGRLYGYHNLVSTLPLVEVKKGEYLGDVKYRKLVSKRLRSLGLNETKTYTLISPQMATQFNYQSKENIVLPNPMSTDKSVIRTSILSSLLNVYNYNKARKVEDIFIYEISKTYDINYNEDIKIAILMKGNYIINNVSHQKIETNFYLIKGAIENILDYIGLKNRYFIVQTTSNDFHPGMTAKVLLDREEIGIIGRIHPSVNKDNIYLAELSLTKLIKEIKPIKYKQSSVYPKITKDLAFIVSNDIPALDLISQIKSSGSRLLTDVSIFDVYTGNNIDESKKSVAFSLTFEDNTKTLTDEEVNTVLDNIIANMTKKFNAVLRDN